MTGRPDGDADVTAVHFSYRGVAYTIDLDATGVADFDAALAPFTSSARRVGGVRHRSAALAETVTGPSDVHEPAASSQELTSVDGTENAESSGSVPGGT